VVALVVTPVSTRDAVAKAEAELAESMAELMDAGEQASRQGQPVATERIDALIIAVDSNVRRLSLVVAPLTRYHVWESRPRQVRHRMTVFAACVGAARTAISHIEHLSGSSEAVASACARVAVLARRLAASQTDNGNVGEGQEQRDERFTWR